MKRKFSRYTIDVSDKKCVKRADSIFEGEATLSGCIEIGLEIDPGTWRGEWLLRLFFGDGYRDYEIISLENNDGWSNKGTAVEINTVKAVFRKRSANLLF